jgi:hypothetical protein
MDFDYDVVILMFVSPVAESLKEPSMASTAEA